MQTIFSFVGIALFIIAAYSDVKSFRIPNLLVAAVAWLGTTRLIVVGDPSAAVYTVGASVIVLAIGFVLFWRGFVGGGDAKLLGAASLLVGYRGLVDFLFLMSLCGAVLGAIAIGRALVGAKLSAWLDYAKIAASFSWARFASCCTGICRTFCITVHTRTGKPGYMRRLRKRIFRSST